MTLIEIILCLTLIMTLFAPQGGAIARVAFALMIVALIGHLVLDGWRWQMFAVYLATVTMLATHWFVIPRWASRIGKTLGGLAALSGVYLAWSMPFLDLPAPDGPNAVGTSHFVFADEARAELFGEEGARRLTMQVWYPAQAISPMPPPVGLWDEVSGGSIDFASFFTRYTTSMPTHSHPNLPPLAGPFPLVLFNHGLAMFPSQSTFLMEALASHGYVVASVSHPFYSLRVYDPETERTRHIDFERGFQGPSGAGADEFGPSLTQASSREERAAAQLERVLANEAFNRVVSIWVEDTRAALDYLEGSTSLSIRRHIDFSRLGVAGMSFGGATAVEFCKIDRRCDAAINIDGTQFGSRAAERFTFPLLMMLSKDGAEENLFLRERAMGPYIQYTAMGALHADYSDLTVIAPLLRQAGFLGTIPSLRMNEITADAVRGFFDEYLLGIDGALIRPAAYLEFQMSSRRQ